MKKNHIYLIGLIVIVALPCFILPDSLIVRYSIPVFGISIVLAMFMLIKFIFETPSIVSKIVTVNKNGEKDYKRTAYVIVASVFIFVAIFGANDDKVNAREFKNHGIETIATIQDGFQKIKLKGGSDEKLKVSFKDQSGEEIVAWTKLKSGVYFDSYSVGQEIKIKYLPYEPTLVIME